MCGCSTWLVMQCASFATVAVCSALHAMHPVTATQDQSASTSAAATGKLLKHRLCACCVVCGCLQETRPCTLTDLYPFTGLTNLQSLIIKAPGADMRGLVDAEIDDAELQLAAQQFPGYLTALTELLLPLSVLHDCSNVSECVRLRDLQLRACDACRWLQWSQSSQHCHSMPLISDRSNR